VEEADIEEAQAFVKQSFNAMVKCLHNPVRNIAVMEDFPMSGNLLRCGRCNFKGICEQGAFAHNEEMPPIEDLEETRSFTESVAETKPDDNRNNR